MDIPRSHPHCPTPCTQLIMYVHVSLLKKSFCSSLKILEQQLYVRREPHPAPTIHTGTRNTSLTPPHSITPYGGPIPEPRTVNLSATRLASSPSNHHPVPARRPSQSPSLASLPPPTASRPLLKRKSIMTRSHFKKLLNGDAWVAEQFGVCIQPRA